MKRKKLKIHSSIKVLIDMSQEADKDLYLKVRENNWANMDIWRAGMFSLKNGKKPIYKDPNA